MAAPKGNTTSPQEKQIEHLSVDVIVKRWQDFTGKTATLESTGEPFEVQHDSEA